MKKTILSLMAFIVFTFLFISCSKKSNITLVGEAHHIKEIQDKELELYRDFYEKGGRHLFIERGYSMASYMNFIMRQEEPFKSMLEDGPEADLDFYQAIKDNFPETIFHGIDAELSTFGESWLQFLQKNNFGTEKEYKTIIEVIEQGKKFHSLGYSKDVYREECLTKNFFREYKKVKGQPIFGIFGSAHTSKTVMWIKGTPTMGMNLEKKRIHYEEIKLDNVLELIRLSGVKNEK